MPNVSLLGKDYEGVQKVTLPDGEGGKSEFSAGGGGPVEVPENDVIFLDYDGTILYSYSAEEFAALTDMPANPVHEGLTAQGWNWTLANAKTYVSKYGMLEIGQMYVTADEKTRIYIEIPEGAAGDQLNFYVRFSQTQSNGSVIDWGDNTTPETISETSATNFLHSYSSPGSYVISISVLNGTVSFTGSSGSSIFGAHTNHYNRCRIKKVEFGTNVEIGAYCFYYCYNLKTVTIPKNIVSRLRNHTFESCYSLSCIILPDDCTTLDGYFASVCQNLKYISFPSVISTLASNSISSCYSLKRISIPSTITTITSSSFSTCTTLKKIIIPDTITAINSINSCYNCSCIIVFPSSPPTLSSAFSNMSKIAIYVPYSSDHSILNAYKTANTWSTYADQIFELPAA